MHLRRTDTAPWPQTLPPNPWYQYQVPAATDLEVVKEGNRVVRALLEDLGLDTSHYLKIGEGNRRIAVYSKKFP